jgi:hypothetical protein
MMQMMMVFVVIWMFAQDLMIIKIVIQMELQMDVMHVHLILMTT